MKNYYKILSMLIMIFLFVISSNANWINNKTQKTLRNQQTYQTPHPNSDSLPVGVTKDWLNSLRDENGNSIIHEKPETDALQRKLFNGLNTHDDFGYSIACASLIAGAVLDSIPDVIMNDGIQNGFFGSSVSAAGDVNGDGYSDIVIGAYGYNSNRGRVYIFYGGSVMDSIADKTITGGASNYLFGYSVSTAGDVNNDGYDDLIIGARGYNSNRGRAYIYFGGMVIDTTSVVIMTGEASSNLFGKNVSNAGDFNNDGYDDVIVGAQGYSSSTGRAYLFLGGIVMNNVPDVTMTGEVASGVFGISVSTAGDVNGDGYSDVIVGAQQLKKAYVFFGGQIMNNIADLTFVKSSGSFFGNAVSTAGDVNGDGYSDIIVGDYGYNLLRGAANLYFGGTAMDTTSDVFMTIPTGNSYFGRSVSNAGDLNNDGFDDVIVGADVYNSFTGRAYVYFGGAVMDSTADVIFKGEGTNNFFGESVSYAGDVNNDGFYDVIIGASGYQFPNIGRAYVYQSISPNITLNLTMFIEGFYNAGSNSQVSDTILVELRNSTSPFALADQSSKIVSANGTVQLKFSNAPGGNYYIAVKQRNSIETWCSGAITLSRTTPASFDLSSSLSQAFGSNMTQVNTSPVRFAIYSGDVNQDGTIDASDVSSVDNDAFNSLSGYVNTDVTGDDFVDAGDVSIVDNNASLSVNAITP